METIETKTEEARMLGKTDIRQYISSEILSDYPKLDVSFFQKIEQIKNPEKRNSKIFVPRFGIVRYYPEQNFDSKEDESRDKRFEINYELQALVEEGNWGNKLDRYLLEVKSNAPHEIQSQIFKGLENEEFLGNNALIGRENSIWQEPNKKIRKNFKRINLDNERAYNRVSGSKLFTYFYGRIPDITKEKVKKAKEVFGKENLYLIWEVEPEQWNASSYSTYNNEKLRRIVNPKVVELEDPLIIGIKESKISLVDHFNCTPLEKLVKDNYVEGKLN